MELLDHTSFGRLRLASFLRGVKVVPQAKNDPGAGRRLMGDVIVSAPSWPWDGREWVGELCGLTEVLRLKSESEITRVVAIPLDPRSARLGRALLEKIGLPLAPGMDRAAIELAIGAPESAADVAGDRTALVFDRGEDSRRYRLVATVHDGNGLLHVLVARVDA